MASIAGGCLCGRLRYTVSAEPSNPHYCSCRQCQRWSGAPVVAWIDAPLSATRIDGALSWHRSSERAQRGFCPSCGSTIFYRSRPFAREVFKDYVFSLSQPHREVLAVAEQLAKSGKYLMATINNESKELNQYRIQTFGLREIFSVFVSSCFVGLRKPEDGIYRLALEVTQKSPQNCCFIDDRALNLEGARQLGMHTIEMQDVEQLRRELRKLEVQV